MRTTAEIPGATVRIEAGVNELELLVAVRVGKTLSETR
jgi:hypothetical protein